MEGHGKSSIDPLFQSRAINVSVLLAQIYGRIQVLLPLI